MGCRSIAMRSWKVIWGLMNKSWENPGGWDARASDGAAPGLIRWVGGVNSFRPAADAGGDRLLGRGLLLPDALRRGFDAVRGLEGFDLFGEF